MDLFLAELGSGLPDAPQLVRLITRLVGAVLLGAVVGMERESVGQPAGLRTHMLVALGSTLFVLACVDAGHVGERSVAGDSGAHRGHRLPRRRGHSQARVRNAM